MALVKTVPDEGTVFIHHKATVRKNRTLISHNALTQKSVTIYIIEILIPMSAYFLTIFILTVVVTRLFLYLRPTPSPTIAGFRTHHYMYGIVGIIAGLFFHSLTTYAIGLGLLVDELTFILMQGKTHADNYSKTSLLGTAIFVTLVSIFHRYFLILFTT